MFPHLVHWDTVVVSLNTIYRLGNLNNLYTHPVHSLWWDFDGQWNVFSLKGNGGFAWKKDKHKFVSLLGTSLKWQFPTMTVVWFSDFQQ